MFSKPTVLLWGVVLSAVIRAGAADIQSTEPSLTRTEWEIFLRSAEIVSAEPDENAGRSEPWHVVLDDGKIRIRAIFKHVDRIRPHPIPDSYRYELAAYQLDKLLGTTFVPPMVEREINDIQGSLQLYLEGCRSLEEIHSEGIDISRHDDFFRNMRDILVFESLTACEHSDEDVLIHMDTGKICRVDFSQAFRPRPEIDPGQEVRESSDQLMANLQKLTEKRIQENLSGYLGSEEIKALIERKQRILAHLKR